MQTQPLTIWPQSKNETIEKNHNACGENCHSLQSVAMGNGMFKRWLRHRRWPLQLSAGRLLYGTRQYRKNIDYVITDDGDSVRLATHVTASWVPARDTLCRALVYYNKNTRQVFTMSQVLVTQPLDKTALDSVPTDPLTLENAWIGGGFLNIGFAVKTGKANEVDGRQSIGIMVDSVRSDSTSIQAITLRLLHAQNNVPQYYSVTGYLSIPMPTTWLNAKITVVANGYNCEQQISTK